VCVLYVWFGYDCQDVAGCQLTGSFEQRKGNGEERCVLMLDPLGCTVCKSQLMIIYVL